MIEYFVKSASSYSPEMDNLFLMITVIIGFWFVLTLALIIYFVLRFRKREGQKAMYITGEKHHEAKWIHYPHYAVLVFDVLILIGAIWVWVGVKQTLPNSDENIRLIAQQWSWTFQMPGSDGQLDTEDDVTLVNDLHVKVGKTYHFQIESRDVIHNFSVPAFRLRQDTVPGRIITGWFKPTQEGEYDIQCAEMCGVGHGIMSATIVVHSEDSYQNTMKAIQEGTYESVHHRRLQEAPTPLPSKELSQNNAFTKKLAGSFQRTPNP